MNLQTIQTFCKERKILWTKHVEERMTKRGITRQMILDCISSGEIIEDYPDDFPFPSCLIFGYAGLEQVILHTVVGQNDSGIYIITAYFPNTDTFEPDMKTRKRKEGET